MFVVENHSLDEMRSQMPWTYALARMSSQPMRARLDKKEVWSVGGYWSSPRSVEDPYQEAADGRFPDPVGPAPKMK